MDIKKARKLHNPKSYSPAVYIPCWLIQVPHSQLSYGAKLLYGRLAQWSSTSGQVFRSSPQLSKEMGMGIRTIERFIKELKECQLIGTFHPQAGGANHFEFYDHPWMYEPLVKELCYEPNDPPPNLAVPPVQPGGTPPPNLADINNKEIKENTTTSSSIFPDYQNLEKQTFQNLVDENNEDQIKLKFREESLADEKCISVFNERYAGLDVTLEELYESCCDYFSQTKQMVYKARFLVHLKKAPLTNYSTKKIENKSQPSINIDEFERKQWEASEQRRKQEYERFVQKKGQAPSIINREGNARNIGGLLAQLK